MIRGGTLRERVSLQAVTEVQDAYGAPAETWADIAGGTNLPAAVAPHQGREFYAAFQLHGESVELFRLRWLAGVIGKTKLRLIWGTRTFDILRAYDPTGRSAEVQVIAKEIP